MRFFKQDHNNYVFNLNIVDLVRENCMLWTLEYNIIDYYFQRFHHVLEKTMFCTMQFKYWFWKHVEWYVLITRDYPDVNNYVKIDYVMEGMHYKQQNYFKPFNRQVIQLEFSPTWSCVSLTRSSTWTEWKLSRFDKMEVHDFEILLIDVTL